MIKKDKVSSLAYGETNNLFEKVHFSNRLFLLVIPEKGPFNNGGRIPRVIEKIPILS